LALGLGILVLSSRPNFLKKWGATMLHLVFLFKIQSLTTLLIKFIIITAQVSQIVALHYCGEESPGTESIYVDESDSG